jgi:hypothetical protein
MNLVEALTIIYELNIISLVVVAKVEILHYIILYYKLQIKIKKKLKGPGNPLVFYCESRYKLLLT